jgi:hypothetical protein
MIDLIQWMKLMAMVKAQDANLSPLAVVGVVCRQKRRSPTTARTSSTGLHDE